MPKSATDEATGSDAAILAIYDPPEDGLPYLAVAIFPSGQVQGVTAKTEADAQAILKGLVAGLEDLSEDAEDDA
jgi:hypothetical protein